MKVNNSGIEYLLGLTKSVKMRSMIRYLFVMKYSEKDIAKRYEISEEQAKIEIKKVEDFVKENINGKKCKYCKEEYFDDRKTQMCDECRNILKKDRVKQNNKINKSYKVKDKVRRVELKPKKTLGQVLIELENYNKKHGTHIGYGEFVNLKGY